MLAVPSRETVATFILLAHTGFANGKILDILHTLYLIIPVDSESEVWMMTGLAVRMSIDLGLHLVCISRSSRIPR